jgi:hypothetical protein
MAVDGDVHDFCRTLPGGIAQGRNLTQAVTFKAVTNRTDSGKDLGRRSLARFGSLG